MTFLKNRGIDVVFFDAGGTLFEPSESVGRIYSRFAERSGLKVDAEIIDVIFRQQFRLQPPLAFPGCTDAGALIGLEYRWWKNLVQDVFRGYEFPRFDRFFDNLFGFFARAEAWRLFDDVIRTLDELKAGGLRLAVISNFDTRLHTLLNELEIAQYFEAVHISSRIGFAKPDPAIFSAALKFHNVKPDEALHIGDNIREDVEGAIAAGIVPILIDRKNRFSGEPGITRISNLQDLIEVRERETR